MMFRLVTALLSCTLAAGCLDDATASNTQAASNGSAAMDGPCMAPPQEAIDACASSTSGAACSFTIDNHSIDGTCRSGRDGNGPLACAPDHPPLPPEAIDACANLSAGATCSFSHDDHQLDGTCRAAPDGNGPLACAPTDPPPGHHPG